MARTGRLITNEAGQHTGYILAIADISKQKRLEAALRANEEGLRLITDTIQDLVTQNDANGNFVFVNPAYRTILGYEPEALIGTSSFALLHPDDVVPLVQTFQAAYQASMSQFSMETRLRHADGHYITVEAVGKFLFDDQGNNAGGIYVSRDITVRKHLETALRQNEERLRLITDNIQDLVTQTDGEGNLVFVNPAYKHILGYDPQSLMGTTSIAHIHPDDLAHLTQLVQAAFQSDHHQFAVESRLRHVDGHYVSVESVGKILFDNQANYAGGVFISRDITERKRIQALQLETEILQAALEKEQELSLLKTRMMERVSHEFRTPLTVIQASTETLTYYLYRLTDDQRTDRADTIKSQIQRLTDMLDQISLVVKGSFAPDQIHRTPTNVSALCRQLAGELAREFDRQIHFTFDLPKIALAAVDPQIIRNAIARIMRNAVQFSDLSAVISLRLFQLQNGIELQVADTGIGIAPYELRRIFEPFFRGSNIGEISGLGIGLTIARAAIEAHRGTISVDSQLKRGTTVTIWLLV